MEQKVKDRLNRLADVIYMVFLLCSLVPFFMAIVGSINFIVSLRYNYLPEKIEIVIFTLTYLLITVAVYGVGWGIRYVINGDKTTVFTSIAHVMSIIVNRSSD